MQLFRTQAQLERCSATSRCCRNAACPIELLDRDQLADAEPALAQARDRLAGGLRLPNDETGDCQLFTTRPGRHRARRWASISASARPSTAWSPKAAASPACGCRRRDVLKADRYVLAFGSYSRDFLRPLGLDMPVYPVKGYSLTVPLVDPALAPESTVLDETYKIAVTRFDDRIRVGGMAELGGFDLRLDPRRRATLEMVVNDLFPGGDLPRATFWTGLRPMTPDGTPIVGATPLRQSVPQHRPRHAGLDHGLRLGQAGGRPSDGTAPGHSSRGSLDEPVSRRVGRAPHGRAAGGGGGLIRQQGPKRSRSFPHARL